LNEDSELESIVGKRSSCPCEFIGRGGRLKLGHLRDIKQNQSEKEAGRGRRKQGEKHTITLTEAPMGSTAL